jgi:D-alanyl-D-alanine carboxypeptidase
MRTFSHDERLRRKPLLTVILALAVIIVLAPGIAWAAPCGEELRPLVEAKMAELGVPGLIVEVDAPGLCQWTATLGTGEAGKRRPMSLDEHMRIGSITKTFTGTVVLQLVDEKRVDLDKPISLYLSGMADGNAITVRQMLQMRSGFYNYSEDEAFNRSLDVNPQKVWTIPELLTIRLKHPAYFAPGAEFHYSNTNTILLGRLVETVTGNSLAAEFQRRIFGPLRMTESSLPALANTAIPRPHPRGYMFGTNAGSNPPACDALKVGRRDVTDVSPSWTWAAGGAVSTLHDLKIWARALAAGTLLTPATQAQRLQFLPIGPSPNAPGYGLNIANYAGLIGHDGNLPGFSSFMGYIPGKDATIVLLANLYPDNTCKGPTDEIVKLIGKKLRLFSP